MESDLFDPMSQGALMKGHDAGRRAFFRTGLKKTLQGLHGVLEASLPDEEHESASNAGPSILADLSPELLAMEADRLGLDPEDKESIAWALQAQMQAAAGERG
jgi:hypothetical protein